MSADSTRGAWGAGVIIVAAQILPVRTKISPILLQIVLVRTNVGLVAVDVALVIRSIALVGTNVRLVALDVALVVRAVTLVGGTVSRVVLLRYPLVGRGALLAQRAAPGRASLGRGTPG